MNLKHILPVMLLLLPMLIVSQNRQADYVSYIKQYHSLALKEQQKYGIPASITLAQGLLESQAGKSVLATTANNHFGIKCSDWTGDHVYQDDDQKHECFRKYPSVEASYEDHSEFLLTRSRYASLFLLPSTDYKDWAQGLQNAGYATNKNYANQLINLIERYDLGALDKEGLRMQLAARHRPIEEKSIAEALADSSSVFSSRFGVIEAPFTHKVYKNNGIKYIISAPGDTYHSIAKEFNLIECLLRYKNEVDKNYVLQPNEVVYLGGKKNQASLSVPSTHQVMPGESMYSISQYYGIKVKKLYEMNGIPYGTPAQTGQVLRLR
jgi:LysM repeat protein